MICTDKKFWDLICRCIVVTGIGVKVRLGADQSRLVLFVPPSDWAPLVDFPILQPLDRTDPTDSAPDNATFTSCGQEKDVYLWDVSAGHVIRKFSGHYGRVNVVLFAGSVSPSPGTRHSGSSVIISGSFDAKVMLWDVRSQGRSPIQTLQESRDSVTTLASGPGGAEIVVGSVDGTVRSYDLRMGKKIEDVIAGESWGENPKGRVKSKIAD